MPDGFDRELSEDLVKLRDHTIRTQGQAAWDAVARFMDLPDEAVADKRRRGGRMADARGGIVGVKPRPAPALTRAPGAPRGVDWKERKGQRGDPTDAKLSVLVVRGRRWRCTACDLMIEVGEEAVVVTTAATQRRYCPPCGTADYRRLTDGKP